MGKKGEPLLPSSIVLWGGVGSGREAIGQQEGAWEEEPRWWVTSQRPHIEAGERALESEPYEVGSVVGPHILPLGSVPRLCCQHRLPEPASGKRNHEIMGWGKLAGPRSRMELRQVHGGALGLAPL